MKAVISIVILILVVGSGYYIWQRNSSETTFNSGSTPSGGSSKPDASNATFLFNEGPITLSKGKSEKEVSPGSVFLEVTELLGNPAYGDINNDGKQDTIVLLARYGVGSGTFIYMGAYVSGPVTYKGTNAVFIGDRVSPQGISIDGDIVTVNFLGREDGEPFTIEPTIQMYKRFRLSGNTFNEI